MPEPLKYQEQSESWFGIYQNTTEPPGLSGRWCATAHNMVVRDGMWHSRPGLQIINGVRCGSSGKRVVYGIDTWRTTTEDQLIIACGDKLQYLPATGGDPVDLTTNYPSSGFTAAITGAFTVFAHLNGQMYIVNGVDDNRKYNGTNLTRMGIVAPTTLSAPSKSAGSLSLTRYYKATLVSSALNGSVESEGTSSTTVSYDAQQGTFSSPSITGSDPQVDRWNLYGSKDNSTFYRINTSPVTTATTIVDNLSDDALIVSTKMDATNTNNVPPGKFQDLVSHQGRLVGFLANSNVLYWSDYGLDPGGTFLKPESWPLANTLEFPDSGGTKLTAVISFYEYVIVFQQYGIWSIRGSLADAVARTISPVLVAPDYRGLGVPNKGCVAVLDNRIVFAGKDGVYSLQRNLYTNASDNLTVTKLSDPINNLYQQTDFTVGACSVADRDNSRFVFVGKGKPA